MKSDRAFAAGVFLAAVSVTAVIICAAAAPAAARGGGFAWGPTPRSCSLLSWAGACCALAAGRAFGRAAARKREARRKNAELTEEMANLAEAAERREEFIASFAHELKTPLTAIIGYADMLRSREMTPKNRFTAAGYIFSEGKRLEASRSSSWSSSSPASRASSGAASTRPTSSARSPPSRCRASPPTA